MEWLATLGDFWLKLLGGLAGLALALGVLGRLSPCNPGMYWWKDLRAVGTDFLYWFVVPVFLRLCRMAMLIAGVALVWGGKQPEFLAVGGLPLWLQCAAVLVLQDVMLYWIHRGFHTRLAWKFHAIHHSPKMLDWLSTLRFHPVNHLAAFVLVDVLVLLMGFSPQALLILAPFNIAYSAMVHANLNWTFGPLRHVFASPVFHRWHHTTEEEGLDKNFASTFPVLDLMFGTFYMPPGRLPEEFGNGERDFPEGFWGQLLHPFIPAAGLSAEVRRRRAIVLAGSTLAVFGLLGVGLYVRARMAERALELERAATQAGQLEQVRRACARNDLVRATVALEEAAGGEEEASEVGELRDLCRRKCLVLAGHGGPVVAVGASSDGRWAVSGCEDGTVKLWDTSTGQERFTFTGHTAPITAVAIRGDGHRLASASFDGTVRLWNADTGREERILKGHTAPVLSVALSADGRRVVSGAADLTAKVWDAATGREERCFPDQMAAVSGVAVSADGRRVVAASGWTAKVWDAATGRGECVLNGHTDLVYGVAIGPDGKQVLSGSFDEKVKVWDADTGKETLSLRGHSGPVYCVGMSADGRLLVSGGKDATVRVWDAQTGGEMLNLKGHTDSVTGLAVNADGSLIVSASRDGTLKVWHTQECRQEVRGEK